MMEAFSSVTGFFDRFRKPAATTANEEQPQLRLAQYLPDDSSSELEDDGLSDEERILYDEWKHFLKRR